MIRNSTFILLLWLSITSPGVFAQDEDPYAIIDSARRNLDKIQDYQADIEIEVDVDFIKMPVKHATIYYKKPDKLKFRSDEFIMLPKKGLGNQLTEILDQPFSAIYLGMETVDQQPHHVIRIVPLGKKPKVILATWWINSKDYRIARNESNTRDEGAFTVDFKYDSSNIPLPAEMIFSFEIEKLNLPLKFIGKSSGMEIDREKMKEVNTGRVYIRFYNYRINSGLPGETFEDVPDDANED